MKNFINEYSGRLCKEDEDAHKYLLGLLEVLGVSDSKFIDFEKKVKVYLNGKRSTKRIDGYIAETKVLIEMKSSDVNLDEVQASGVTPQEQAFNYIPFMKAGEEPNYVVVCNFKEMRIYDRLRNKDIVIYLQDFERKVSQLRFLVDKEENPYRHSEKLSEKSVSRIKTLYDLLKKQYIAEFGNNFSLKDLNILCVRLVFCLFAEKAGVFKQDQFIKYFQRSKTDIEARDNLQTLFKVLNTEVNNRDITDSTGANDFPYVNGGLFKECINIPTLTLNIRTELANLGGYADGMLHNDTYEDWGKIDPPIFGAIFETTIDPDHRHDNGMHYTSRYNIHKVIDRLFLDGLKEEFNTIIDIDDDTEQFNKLIEFQNKIANLKFLDPACGSGNFLTETYICLRRLENKVIEHMQYIRPLSKNASPIKVTLEQFYGIEIDDFAVSVARTALWIAELQLARETKDFGFNIDLLPLKSNNNIVEGNALRLDWEEVVNGVSGLNYIIGNPPFLGARRKGDAQWDDIQNTFPKSEWRNVGNFDYVLCWFKKSVDLMQRNKSITASLVATNSICQGEPVGTFWKRMLELGVHINFAYKSFIWENDDKNGAAVAVIIIGFSLDNCGNKYIIDNNGISTEVYNINPYLIEADDIVVETVNKPICNVPEIHIGSMPQDGGYLSKISTQEKDAIIAKYPQSKEWFKPLIGADEFLKGKERWCLWLVGVDIEEIKKVPPVYKHVEACRKYRENQTTLEAQKTVNTPHLFARNKQPDTDYMIIPKISTIGRDYLIIGYADKDIITTDANQIIDNASKYLFAIINSDIHNIWAKTVSGYLGTEGLRYSAGITYNNFPFITPTSEEKAKLEQLANNILQARANHPNKSLADLYDPDKMPADLRAVHRANDEYVRSLYGFTMENTKEYILAGLLTLYKKLTQGVNSPDVVVLNTDFEKITDNKAKILHIISKIKTSVDNCVVKDGFTTYISEKLTDFYKSVSTLDNKRKCSSILKKLEKLISSMPEMSEKSLHDAYNIFNDTLKDMNNDFRSRLLISVSELCSLVENEKSGVDAAASLRNLLGVNRYYIKVDSEFIDITDTVTDIDKNRYKIEIQDGHLAYNYFMQLLLTVSFNSDTDTELCIDDFNTKYKATIVMHGDRGNKIFCSILTDS